MIFYIFPFYISSRSACFYDWIILFVQQWDDEHRSRLRGSWMLYLQEAIHQNTEDLYLSKFYRLS